MTREINFQYLWVDALCIIQGGDGDCPTESIRMEAVFNGAYCVIAASSVAGSSAPSLTPRYDRQYMALGKELQSRFYLCEDMDDFQTELPHAGGSREQQW